MDYKTILEQLRAEHARVCGAIAHYERTGSPSAPITDKRYVRTQLPSTHTCRAKSPVEFPAWAQQPEPAVGCQRLLKLLQRYTSLTLQAARSTTLEGRLEAEDAWRAAEKHRLEHRC
jgi:hypothetical protein